MPAYDIIMLTILGIATIFGAIKGFAWQVASLASVVVSYLVAYYFRNDVAKMVNASYPWNLFLSMLILYGGSSFLIWMVFRLISNVIDQFRLKEFDRHMGALLGLGKGTVYCLLVTMFAMTLLGTDKQKAICDSRSGYFMSKILANANGVLPKEVEQIIGPHLDRLEKKLENGRGGEFATNPSLENNWGWENPNGQSNNSQWQNPTGQATPSGSGIPGLGELRNWIEGSGSQPAAPSNGGFGLAPPSNSSFGSSGLGALPSTRGFGNSSGSTPSTPSSSASAPLWRTNDNAVLPGANERFPR